MHLTNRGSPRRPCGQLACGSPQDHQTNTGMHLRDLVGIVAFGTPQGSPDTQKVTWETLWAFSPQDSTGITRHTEGHLGDLVGILACGSPQDHQTNTGMYLGDLVGIVYPSGLHRDHQTHRRSPGSPCGHLACGSPQDHHNTNKRSNRTAIPTLLMYSSVLFSFKSSNITSFICKAHKLHEQTTTTSITTTTTTTTTTTKTRRKEYKDKHEGKRNRLTASV